MVFVVAGANETDIGEIVLTQKDIRALQLAKGAVHSGIEILCRAANRDHPERIILAGSFGSHVNTADLVTIGLIPPISAARVRIVGNAAGAGAVMAVLSPSVRAKAQEIANEIQVIELAAQPDFQEVFLNSLSFPNSNNDSPVL